MGVRDVELPPLIPQTPEQTVDVTTRRVALAVATLQVLVLAVVAVEWVGLPLPVVRPVVTVVYLTLVPGYLLLRLAGVTDESRVETLLYSVGLSLVALMATGVASNFTLRLLGVERPMSEIPVVLSVSAVVCALTWAYRTRVDEEVRVTVDTDRLTSPLVLGLALLPLAGVYGGLVLTRFGTNLPLLALYTVLLAIPVYVVRDRIPPRLFPYAIWTVALALLLQNTLSGHYMAWGDSPKEASLALGVLADGYWAPSLVPGYGNKYTMLRLVILHPVYALFTDLRFVWVFKVVHPLIFSLMPVALYHAYEQYVDGKTAFLSAYLFVSLFSFFIVLSRNTRTATALLFISLFLLLVATKHVAPNRRKLLAILFVAGVLVSHYGVSYMFMLMLGLVIPVRWVLERLSSANRTSAPLTSVAFVILYGLMLFAWYVYVSPGSKSFDMLVGTGLDFFNQAATQFAASGSGGGSVTTHYVTADYTSTTLSALRVYNVVVGGIMIFGLGWACLRLVRNRDLAFDAEYVAYASVALATFGFTFVGIERFNTARTYPTTLLFYAPFFVLGFTQPFALVGRYVERVGRLDARQIATVAVVVFLALNVGFVSAVATDEYSTNALVEKERIAEEGLPPAKSYLFKQYPTVHDMAGSAWLGAAGVDGRNIYVSRWPGNRNSPVGHTPLSPAERDDSRGAELRPQAIRYPMVSGTGTIGDGYLYMGALSHPEQGDLVTLPGGRYAFNYVETSEKREHWAQKHLVYDNGGSRVYYGDDRSTSRTTDRGD
jgi:uncharacterized membrane protein